jgi:hypothetical protein
MTDQELKKMFNCSYMLPEPGGKVVRDLLEEIKKIKEEISELKNIKSDPA